MCDLDQGDLHSNPYVIPLQELFTTANISFTDYIRTTERRHVALVEEFWVSINTLQFNSYFITCEKILCLNPSLCTLKQDDICIACLP